jgi:predicted Fe-Mo cluster-binding NifX family protein
MKIAVSSTGTTKDAPVDQRFGRCKYFSIYDIDSKTYSTVANEAQLSAGGAGIQAVQNVADSGVSMVLTGNIGPNAYKALQAAGITVITGISGTVAEALEKFSKGDYWPSDKPTVQPHFGISS